MTKKDLLFAMMDCYKLLALDYHDFIKSNYMYQSINRDTDVYSIMLTQKNIAMAKLKFIMCGSGVLSLEDLKEINSIDYKKV